MIGTSRSGAAARLGARAARAGAALALALSVGTAAAQDDDGDGTSAAGAQAPALTIGGGVPFGLYFPLAGAICRAVETAPAATGAPGRCNVASMPDSAAAISALDSGRLDMALVQSDWLAHAVNGTSRFRGDAPASELRAVAALHGEGLVIFVRAADDLAGPADLAGLRLVRGRGQSYRALLSYALLRAADRTPEDLAAGTTQAVNVGLEMLCAGRTDAVAAVTAAPDALLAAAPPGCAVTALPVAADTAETAAAEMPGVAAFSLPAPDPAAEDDAADGADGRIESLGLTAVLTARAETDAARVTAVLRALRGDIASIAGMHPALGDLDAAGMARGARFAPPHEAARRFYAETNGGDGGDGG